MPMIFMLICLESLWAITQTRIPRRTESKQRAMNDKNQALAPINFRRERIAHDQRMRTSKTANCREA
jgi:hypothetical protein